MDSISPEIDSIKPRKSPALARRWAIAAFVILFLVAIPLDIPVSTWAHNVGVAAFLKNSTGPKVLGQHFDLPHFIRLPGNGVYTVLMTVVLLIRDRRFQLWWRNAAIVALAGIFSTVNAAFKWMIGRIRPFHGTPPFTFHPFKHGFDDLSFPSGDATLAFAMAASLSMVMPRAWWVWWLLAIVVGLERIAENAHYPSDVVAGAALGVGVAMLARRLVQRMGGNAVSNEGKSPEVI